jgi:uncharacterized protein YciI
MYFALVYDLADDYLERRPAFREEHLALAQAAVERGELRLGGAFAEPADHALLVWQAHDRAVVERFVAQDPYVTNGLVISSTIREWSVVIGADAPPM